MPGLQKNKSARYKLISSFWWIVSQAGIDKMHAYEVVERLYNKNSLRLLTLDELKRVVDELAECTGVELRKPLPKQKIPQKDLVVVKGDRIIEMPTRDQLSKIEYLADRMRMSQDTLQGLIKKAGGDPQLDRLSARKLTEMLKSMHARGWKDNRIEKKTAAGTRDN
jgi:phage gp16-like protein